MKIYLIQPVRKLTPKIQLEIEKYVSDLEKLGNTVYCPHRDTNQDDPTGYKICCENFKGIFDADEIHIIWDNQSYGSHFDLGMAFALNKKIKIVSKLYAYNESLKCFEKMMDEWSRK